VRQPSPCNVAEMSGARQSEFSMNRRTVNFRCPLGLYEQLEREALERKISVAEVIIERLTRKID